MIAYDIVCENSHKFEGWFKSCDDYESQKEKDLLECPVCGSRGLERIFAPAVRTSKPPAPPAAHDINELRKKVTDYLEKNFDNVGNKFTEEARKIYYNEAEARNIIGTATKEERESLKEEGIDCIALPATPKLNS